MEAAARPWWDALPRATAEVTREWDRVQALSATMAAKNAGLEASQLDSNARGLLGLRAAAAWTVGAKPVTPITRRPLAPGFDSATAELHAAELVLDARGDGWDYAVGVLRWLDWVLEVVDEVRYPPV